ncbi:MAG: hypothetical protein PHS57_06255 [Alphaproteobacteria bacterium]|nr:hypothetical protein [Alphaproteobacteria bacterium]
MKALSVFVYRNSCLGDCTNGGISAKHDRLLVLCKDGNVTIDEENPPENLVKLVHRVIGRDVYHLEPVAPAAGVGWMAGGNYAGTSDSLFSEMTGIYGAISIHDRDEDQETYDILSR